MTEEDGRTAVADPSDDELGAQTMRGLKWTYVGTVLQAVMQLIYTAVMSRLLDPQEFGLFAIGSLAVMFTTFLAEMGVGQALIQKPELTEDDVRAGWTSMVGLGAAFTVGLAAAAPWVADLFRDPDAVAIVRVFAIQFFVAGLGNTARALLRRELRFRALTAITVAAFGASYLGVGIVVALMGGGVWSLVAATLASQVIGSAARYLTVRHTVRFTLRWAAFRPLYAYGLRASFGQFTEYLGNNLDTLVVGRFATTALLGQYNRAFYLINLPLSYLVNAISQVLFPSYSRIQDDPARLREVYVRSIAVAGSLLVPIAFGVGVAADEVVATVLGDQWDTAAAVVPILTVAAAARVMTRFALIAADARAELNLRVLVQVVHIALLAVLLWLAAGGPLTGYAIALSTAEGTRFLVYLVAMRRVTGVDGQDITRAYLPVVVSTVTVVLAISVVRWAGHALGLGPVALFLLDALTGGVALTAIIRSEPLWLVRREVELRLRGGQLLRQDSRAGRVVRLVLGPSTPELSLQPQPVREDRR